MIFCLFFTYFVIWLFEIIWYVSTDMCFLFIVQFLELNISERENFTETIRKDIFYLERFSKKIAQRSLIF